MARYTGPKSRIDRRFGETILGSEKVRARRNFPPGQHGNNRRRKTSEYGIVWVLLLRAVLPVSLSTTSTSWWMAR